MWGDEYTMTDRLTGGFFLSVIESSMDSVRVLDEEGRLLFMNRGGIAAFEIRNVQALIGRPCRSLWPEPAATQIDLGVEAARLGGTHRFEGMCPTASGVEKWWDVFIAPVRDDAGRLAAIIATSRDVTLAHTLRLEAEARARELDRNAAALRSAFRVAHVGGWEVDFVRGETRFAPELTELLGLPLQPVMATSDANALWSAEDRSRIEDALARVESEGERLIFEGRIAATGQSWRLFGEPVLENGRCVALRGAAQDITDWRDALDRERAAIKAAEAMSGFLATMSHELRTPLNGVLGMAQAMAQGDLSPGQRARLATIEESGAALLSLLNDLLDLSKIEAGKVELEDSVVDVAALIEGARSVFTALMRDKDLSLAVSAGEDALGLWRGDPTRVRQVLHNLIANAVKFTDRGSVEVAFSRAPDGLTFSVRDSGIGIAADMLESVFERFVQADASMTRRYGGSGLGLSICRELVSLMGGDIQVSSLEGVGSTFTVRLPLQPVQVLPDLPATPAPDAASPEVGQLRVLAAEDNPVNQIVLKTLLGEAGIEATIVGDGQAALEAWRGGDWDIVLMDIQMPVLDGVSAVRSMRRIEQDEGRGRTPVIAVTANAMSHQAAEYREAGMDAVVPKPIDLATLLNAMDAVLSS